MADILFVTWDGGGNVPPAIGIATELQRRGHHVRFLGHAGQAAELDAAGLPFREYVRARPFSSQRPGSPLRLIRMAGDRGMGEDLLAEVTRQPTDLVVVDCMLLGALDAARRAGLRYVPLEHFLDGYYRGSLLRGPVGWAARLRGLRPHQALAAAPLVLAATLESIDPGAAAPRPDNLRFTGPVVAPVSEATPVEPTVLVSMSSFGYPGMTRVLQGILDATAGLDARVVVTTGPIVDPTALTPHARAEVHRWVDHDELMREASLVVGHGGHGTTMRALAHGLPLLVVPVFALGDQPMVGRMIADAGLGQTLDPTSSPHRLRTAIAALLEDGPHRRAAASVGAQIRARPGAAAAADLLEVASGVTAPS